MTRLWVRSDSQASQHPSWAWASIGAVRKIWEVYQSLMAPAGRMHLGVELLMSTAGRGLEIGETSWVNEKYGKNGEKSGNE